MKNIRTPVAGDPEVVVSSVVIQVRRSSSQVGHYYSPLTDHSGYLLMKLVNISI